MSIQNHHDRHAELTNRLDEARAVLASLIVEDNGSRLDWLGMVGVLAALETMLTNVAGEADIWLDEAKHLEMKREGQK